MRVYQTRNMVMPHHSAARRTRCTGAFSLAFALALTSCHGVDSPTERPLLQPPAAPSPLEADAASEVVPHEDEVVAPVEVDEATLQAARLARFQREVVELSEPDADFFSENFISNETSYLHVAKPLRELTKPGGAYLGVGPEQNFSYIALSRPEVAYIVDIRRQNLLLHLLYKAAFVGASSRSHFLTILLGRPYDRSSQPTENAEISEVIAHAERVAPDRDFFLASHRRISKQIEQEWGIPLSDADEKQLSEAHRAFFDDQLDIRFSLAFNNGRSYPTLRSLLSTETTDGETLGFLASEEAFQVVRTIRAIPARAAGLEAMDAQRGGATNQRTQRVHSRVLGSRTATPRAARRAPHRECAQRHPGIRAAWRVGPIRILLRHLDDGAGALGRLGLTARPPRTPFVCRV